MIDTELQQQTGIVFTCPGCGASAIEGRYHELHWTWFGLSLGRERFLRCGMCNVEFMLTNSAPEIHAIAKTDWADVLIPPSSTKGKALATLAIVSFWIPLLGFWLARRAYRVNAQAHGLSKSFAISALIMSGLFTGGFVMAIVVVPLMLLVVHLSG